MKKKRTYQQKLSKKTLTKQLKIKKILINKRIQTIRNRIS